MRLVSFYPDRETDEDAPVVGVLHDGWIIDIPLAAAKADLEWGGLDLDLGDVLTAEVFDLETFARLAAAAPKGTDHAGGQDGGPQAAYRLGEVDLAAPVPGPTSMRDFYAFEQHVKAARARRGLDMIPEWYDIPVFYFTNHNAVQGPQEIVLRPRRCRELDFELEIACVIGEAGIDIKPEDAEGHILGYTIMNDWSARDLQRDEMKMNLGPAKGKDFATSLGPWVVTIDELAGRALGDGRYDMRMVARINGEQVSEGNFRDITHSFPELIARASADVWLLPGDVLGSGTVGTGCILELGPENVPWLEPGDVVELEIEGLGVLSNLVEATPDQSDTAA